jgi:hypothetical protein
MTIRCFPKSTPPVISLILIASLILQNVAADPLETPKSDDFFRALSNHFNFSSLVPLLKSDRNANSLYRPPRGVDPSTESHVSPSADTSLTVDSTGKFEAESDKMGGHEDEKHSSVHAPAILFITLTLVVGGLSMMIIHFLDEYVMIPYTVLCLVMGCLYGILSKTWTTVSPLTLITKTNPQVFLLTFLPILIYESAFCMQTHLFKKLTLHILIIGSVGMGKHGLQFIARFSYSLCPLLL